MSKWFNRGVSFKGLLGELHETGDKGLPYVRLQDEDLDTGAREGLGKAPRRVQEAWLGRETGITTHPLASPEFSHTEARGPAVSF